MSRRKIHTTVLDTRYPAADMSSSKRYLTRARWGNKKATVYFASRTWVGAWFWRQWLRLVTPKEKP